MGKPKNLMTLTAEERRIYDSMCSQIEALKTEYVFPGVNNDDLGELFHLALENRPDLFWVSGDAVLQTTFLNGKPTASVLPEFCKNAGARQIAAQRQQLESRVKSLIWLAKTAAPDVYGQILFLHDYLVDHTDYVDNGGHCFDAYGCLIEGEAVCAGYAAAFMLLMQRLGVPCGKTHGYSSAGNSPEESHVWNYIRLDDGYYYVDVTWDDPKIIGGVKERCRCYTFFCVNLQELRQTHRINEGQLIPQKYGTKYEYYRYMGRYFPGYSFEAVRAAAEKQLRSGKSFSVKFGSPAQTKLAEKDLIDGNKIYSIPGVSNSIAYNVSKTGLILQVTVL